MTVKLPLSQQTLPRLEPPSNGSQDIPALTGLQILAVDNEVNTLEILKFALESYGAEVLTVTTAREALSALSAAPSQYDLLISDIGMPEEDGYFLIQQVRALSAEAGGQILAIALTAKALLDIGMNCKICPHPSPLPTGEGT